MAVDTIFAVSSGRPPAGIAVIRISGPEAMAAGERIAGHLPEPRHAALRDLCDVDGELLDRALVLCFPAPATVTGEDVVELHCHGGQAVVASVEAALSASDGLRHAEPGEFTRRALTNGRIDLLEAEGLADLLAAETEAQRRAALAGAGGVLSRRVRGWMDELAPAAAEIEVQIDYVDEGDVAIGTSLARPLAIVDRVAGEMRAVLEQPSVDRIRDGIKVVVAGPPNTGKSSLINVLAGRDVAITSPIAGTTRDRLEAPVSRAGVAFVLTDTAGITDTDDIVERIGVQRARQAQLDADLILWTGDDVPDLASDAPVLHLWTLADVESRRSPYTTTVPFSIYDDTACERVWAEIGAFSSSVARPEIALFSRQQRSLIEHASCILNMVFTERTDPILVAEAIRTSRVLLARLTGENASSTMLDALFARFCLGK